VTTDLGPYTFFSVTAISDTLVEARKLPTPSGVPAARPGSSPFFGEGEQIFANQNFILTFELFHGLTAFRPRDWEIRFTPVIQFNYLDTRETSVVNVDPRESTSRFDTDLIGIQEALVEIHLMDLSPNYDFVSSRWGIQPFLSDFRGFLFADNEPGVRLFGNLREPAQWNAVYFHMLEKDTNSGLNRLISRDQNVAVANLYYQDFIWRGYTAQLSFHYNNDQKSTRFDDNGFINRPAAIGAVREHEIDAYYIGWAGDGHIGPLNPTHQFYGAGQRHAPAHRPAQDRHQRPNGASRPRSTWTGCGRRPVLWASATATPGTARPAASTRSSTTRTSPAGRSASVRQGIGLTGARVNLVNRNSLVTSLRPRRSRASRTSVNPGLFLFNVGLTPPDPKLKASFNVNYLRFEDTDSIKVLLFQSKIREDIGWDLSVGLQYWAVAERE
jgi:hypothetical protein